MKKKNIILAQNKKASYNYKILETYEAGIVLTGTEIKSIRLKHINLKDGYIQIRNNQVWMVNVHISVYSQGNMFNHDPLRPRKLLLHKKEIMNLSNQIRKKGITIIPLKVYIYHGFAKVLIGVAEGKHLYDKRESIKRKDQNREISRVLKHKFN